MLITERVTTGNKPFFSINSDRLCYKAERVIGSGKI